MGTEAGDEVVTDAFIGPQLSFRVLLIVDQVAVFAHQLVQQFLLRQHRDNE